MNLASLLPPRSNIKLACRLLEWRRLSCFGHNLDLAINKGIKDHRMDRVLHLVHSCLFLVAGNERGSGI